jgi:undecaprenyl-diphosphatase
MTAHPMKRPRRSLVPIVAVSTASLVFAVLLVLVRLQWAPLESADHRTAVDLNSMVAGHAAIVRLVRVVTWLGSDGVLWTVVGVLALVLAIRRRWRLAGYLVVTSAGALVLDPVLKDLVGRLRPTVAHPIAHGTGNSFPSGHSLGSIVCYGAILLVFLPAASGRWRTAFKSAVIALVALIGASRLLLGVHYVSDVVGGWAIGVAWIGLTAYAFEVLRRESGRHVTEPLAEGLEPESPADLRPAEPEPERAPARGRHPARTAAAVVIAWVVIAWVFIVGATIGIGELVTTHGNGNLLGDSTIPHWFATHRTPGLTRWSLVFSVLGATQAILIVSAATCIVFLAATRRWRPVIFVVTLMFGELGAFLTAAEVVKRPRPDVGQLDHHLPTSAFPSGHEAATCCAYAALAILVIGHARGWWRWLTLVPAIAMPVLVALSRMYRGEHHPTDLAGSVVLAALWLTATYLLIKPNIDGAGRRPATTAKGRVAGRDDRVPAAS